MSGPPKTPTSLKVITGTMSAAQAAKAAANNEEPVLPVLTKVPPPPDWLPNSHATREWKRLAQILVANRLLNEAGLSGLGHLCALHGKIVQLWAAGECPTGFLVSQYRALINDYAITPAAAGRLKMPTGGSGDGNGNKENPFSRNGRPTAR